MNHRNVWITLISFSFILLWGTYIQYHYMQKYDTMVEHYENKVNEYEVSEKVLHKQLDNLQKENENILSELEIQSQQFKELEDTIANLYMAPPESRFAEAIAEKKYMVAENITIRKVPSDKEAFYSDNVLSYKMVTPIAVVFEPVMNLQDRSWNEEDRHWVLISHRTYGEMVDTHGWVKFSELIEYNEDTMHLLNGPFVLSEDAVDIETGELVHSLLRGNLVNVEFTDEGARVSTDGGIYAYVDKKYVLYPEDERKAVKVITIMAYIKEIDNEVILFDEVEWINMPSERAAELGIKVSDAPSGFLIYNEENIIAECNIADNCEIYILDWENLYEEKQITLDIFKQRGNLQIPYILTIEDGRVINISERYIP